MFAIYSALVIGQFYLGGPQKTENVAIILSIAFLTVLIDIASSLYGILLNGIPRGKNQ